MSSRCRVTHIIQALAIEASAVGEAKREEQTEVRVRAFG
jgi:hypothetical protein